MQIAMWSGPRNLSTAMMYAFAARSDCAVVDEPFYAAYLNTTGLPHPMRAEILESQSQDPAQVSAGLIGEVPEGKAHYYQKHMTQHMLENVPRAWMAQVRNVFLIRHPARVIASFAAKYDQMTLADIGFAQQAELFEQVQSWGQTPIVIDSADIRRAPEVLLKRLCAALDLTYEPAMLHWPAGGHPQDGVWASHWYGAVHRSSGFASAEGEVPKLEGPAAQLLSQALQLYQKLEAYKI